MKHFALRNILAGCAAFLSVFAQSCKKDSADPEPGDTSGVYAVYSTGGQWNNREAFLWKDEVRTELTNTNPAFTAGTNMYVTRVAVSASGDVYMAGGECLRSRRDFPNVSEFVDSCYTVLWKNGVKQYLNNPSIFRWFMKGLDIDMAINDNNDVFVLGRDSEPNTADYSVWKNGNVIININDAYANISKMFVRNNDVYLCGDTYSAGQNKALIWKNGALQVLANDTYSSAIYVAENNDVYVGLGNGKLLKNNVAQTLVSASGQPATGIDHILGKDSDMYVMGTAGGEHIIWKNGTQLYKIESPLSAYNYIHLQSMAVSGDDVYVSGVLSNSTTSSGGPSAAVIYKNGVLYKTMFDGHGTLVDAPSVFVK